MKKVRKNNFGMKLHQLFKRLYLRSKLQQKGIGPACTSLSKKSSKETTKTRRNGPKISTKSRGNRGQATELSPWKPSRQKSKHSNNIKQGNGRLEKQTRGHDCNDEVRETGGQSGETWRPDARRPCSTK